MGWDGYLQENQDSSSHSFIITSMSSKHFGKKTCEEFIHCLYFKSKEKLLAEMCIGRGKNILVNSSGHNDKFYIKFSTQPIRTTNLHLTSIYSIA